MGDYPNCLWIDSSIVLVKYDVVVYVGMHTSGKMYQLLMGNKRLLS